MLTTHNPAKIVALNDAARKSFSGCHVYMTSGVQALYQTQAIVALHNAATLANRLEITGKPFFCRTR